MATSTETPQVNFEVVLSDGKRVPLTASAYRVSRDGALNFYHNTYVINHSWTAFLEPYRPPISKLTLTIANGHWATVTRAGDFETVARERKA